MKQNFSRGHWLRYALLAVALFTCGFQIRCPPPESLENIDTDLNPAFHDGVNSSDFYSPPKINAVVVDPRTGNFFVGGSFTSIDNVVAVNIAFYDKTQDRFYRLFGKGLRSSNEFFSSSVNALAISGSYLYIGGNFSQTAGPVPTTGLNNIARYNIGSGSVDDVSAGFFEAVSSNGLNGVVHALEVFDNELFVGGSFSNTSLGSTPNLNNIARFSINCSSNCWSAVQSGFNGTVYALKKGDYGSFHVLYIGGEFTQLLGSSLPVNRFSAFRPLDNAVIGFPGLNGTVKALAYEPRRARVYAGGSFTSNDADNAVLNHIAYFSGGPSFLPLPENGFNGDVNALAVKEYLVFAGGDFTQTVNNPPTALSRIAVFDSNPDEQTWTRLASGLNDTVSALAIDDPGTLLLKRLIVGGNFTRNGDNLGETLKRVVAFDFYVGPPTVASFKNLSLADTWSRLGLPGNRALNGAVSSTAVDSSGNIYVGGLFTNTSNGADLNRIGRYDPTTKTWSPLANGGLNDNVESMIIVGDNIYVGGYFTATADGAVTNLNRIARYNLTTNTWSSVGNNGLSANFGAALVSAFAVKDNILYVGGNFTRTFDNAVSNLNNLAAYDLTTNTWSPFADNGMNGPVNTLAIAGDDLYIGGGFTRTANNFYFLFRITRFNLTKQTWFEFANSGLDGEAKHLTVAGNYVFVNGYFSRTKDNTIILNNLGRYDIGGNSWANLTGDTEARKAAVQTNSILRIGNEIFTGGNFRSTGNSVANFFTQIYLQKWNVPAPTTDWFDNANWKLGSVPSYNSNAVIPAAAGNINIAAADVVLNDLNFNGGTLDIAAGRTLTINGILSLNGGSIEGNGTLIITNCQPDGIMGGDSAAYIRATLVRCINNFGSFNFPVGTANGYSPITVKNITGTGNISVRSNQGAYSFSATGLPANRLARWWQITNPGGGVTNSHLYFNYSQSDVAGNEYGYRAYRVSGGTANMIAGNVNSFSNIVSASGVTGFSDWTLAEFAPSAATVSVGGRVVSYNGRGIAKAVVTLTGQGGNVWRTVTGSLGYYRFDDVSTGQTCVLSVGSKRYQFGEPTRVITVADDALDIDFVALP